MRTEQERGDLSYFNQACRVYRVNRVARGQPMSYTAARSRLKRTLTEVAAGKAAAGAIVTRVFGGE